jgi:hypothetical protein
MNRRPVAMLLCFMPVVPLWNENDPGLKARMKQTRSIVVQHSYRVLANGLVFSTYRNAADS